MPSLNVDRLDEDQILKDVQTGMVQVEAGEGIPQEEAHRRALAALANRWR